ncbi:MAG: glycosyltransferase, partial [Desulfonatronovibrio sp.]
IFFPPIKSVTGGMQVLIQLAEQFQASNTNTAFYLWEDGHETMLKNKGFEVMVGKNTHFAPEDIFLVPEGWPNVLPMALNSGARCVVYCQNWAYLFSGLPEDVAWSDLPVDFISVSDPVRIFIKESLGKDAPVIRPYIDQSLFAPFKKKPKGIINISYMPRKNRALYKQIRRVFEARNRNLSLKIKWINIEGLEQQEVAQHLKNSHIFLTTGFPEGFSLPPLEAMACGCLVTGFAGFGGWDYMRQACNGYLPQIPLRPAPWQGNGLFCADGDVLSAALNLEKAVQLIVNRDEKLSDILENSIMTAQSFSRESQAKEIAECELLATK